MFDAGANIAFLFIEHHERYAGCRKLLNDLGTYTSKATHNRMIAQCRDLVIHEMPPDRLTEMPLDHKFHPHPKCIEQRPYSKNDYYYRKQPASFRKRTHHISHRRHHIDGCIERINERKPLDQHIAHSSQHQHTEHQNNRYSEMANRFRRFHSLLSFVLLLAILYNNTKKGLPAASRARGSPAPTLYERTGMSSDRVW